MMNTVIELSISRKISIITRGETLINCVTNERFIPASSAPVEEQSCLDCKREPFTRFAEFNCVEDLVKELEKQDLTSGTIKHDDSTFDFDLNSEDGINRFMFRIRQLQIATILADLKEFPDHLFARLNPNKYSNDYDRWYVPLASYGDYSGSLVEKSNLECLLDSFEFISEYRGHYGHRAAEFEFSDFDNIVKCDYYENIGSFELEESEKMLQSLIEFVETLEGLENYPLISEDQHINDEQEAIEESWESCYRREMQQAIAKKLGLDFDDLGLSDEEFDQIWWDIYSNESIEFINGRGDQMYLDVNREEFAARFDLNRKIGEVVVNIEELAKEIRSAAAGGRDQDWEVYAAEQNRLFHLRQDQIREEKIQAWKSEGLLLSFADGLN